MKKANTREYDQAVKGNCDRWVPACGGHETEFQYNGKRFLYCYNPKTHEHAHIDLDTDMVEPNPCFMK